MLPFIWESRKRFLNILQFMYTRASSVFLSGKLFLACIDDVRVSRISSLLAGYHGWWCLLTFPRWNTAWSTRQFAIETALFCYSAARRSDATCTKLSLHFLWLAMKKIIQRIPITNVNCHWWVWILFSFGFLTGPSVCIKYLTHCSEWEVEVFWLSSTCSKHKLFIWKVNRKVGMESGQQRSCVRFRDLAVQYLLIVIQMLTSSIKIQVTVMRNWSVE